MENNKQGAIALIFVIMVTTLTIVAGLAVSLANISDLTASYHVSESEQVTSEIDSCIDDALVRIASSTSASGTYYLNSIGINCYYTIGSEIDDSVKIVTSTASTTSDVGYWEDTIVISVNVSSTPIYIQNYKHSQSSYSSFGVCGDGIVNDNEVCDDGNTFTESCGNFLEETGGPYCNSTCTAVYAGGEACDDGNRNTEYCGDGTLHDGGPYCNANCSAVYAGGEACDYEGGECGIPGSAHTEAVGCGTKFDYLCEADCSLCTLACEAI